jgi:hypothetical protein
LIFRPREKREARSKEEEVVVDDDWEAGYPPTPSTTTHPSPLFPSREPKEMFAVHLSLNSRLVLLLGLQPVLVLLTPGRVGRGHVEALQPLHNIQGAKSDAKSLLLFFIYSQ